MSDLDARTVANQIKTGKIKPSDNFITFRLLDSLTNPSSSSRAFFLPIANEVIINSDGALSEVIGGYLIDYLSKHPLEFAKNLDDQKLHDAYKDQIAFELYASYDFQKNSERIKVVMDKSESEVLLDFYKEVIMRAEEIKNGD
jgi:hypothetical protein